MVNAFQEGYYVISTIVDYDFDTDTESEYEVIIDGPYLTEAAARQNNNLHAGSGWVEYLTFENFEMVADGDSR